MSREVILPAPREAVWEALTRPDQLSAWFGAQAELDLRPGGALRFAWSNGVVRRGLVEHVRPPESLSFRWRATRLAPEGRWLGEGTRVEFLLEAVEEGTRLRLIEARLSLSPDPPATTTLVAGGRPA